MFTLPKLLMVLIAVQLSGCLSQEKEAQAKYRALHDHLRTIRNVEWIFKGHLEERQKLCGMYRGYPPYRWTLDDQERLKQLDRQIKYNIHSHESLIHDYQAYMIKNGWPFTDEQSVPDGIPAAEVLPMEIPSLHFPGTPFSC